MFSEPVEASIDLQPHLFYCFRRHVPDLLFDISVAVPSRIQFRRRGRQPFDTDIPFRRQVLFYNACDWSEIGPKSLSTAARDRIADAAVFSPPVAHELLRGNDAYKSARP
jgi:hypothetical protein